MRAAVIASPIGVEALDDPTAEPGLVRRMLSDLRRSNRWLGGLAAARRGIRLLLDDADRGRTLRLLDIGAGAGDVTRDAVRFAARQQVALQPLALERHRAAAAMANQAGIGTVFGCGTALPFADDSIDIVLIAQLLHHFADDTAVQVLREAHRVASRGVVITDLHPSRLSAIGYRLVGPLLFLHPVTIADGVTSLARGRSAGELMAMAHSAGELAPVGMHLPFSRVLVAWRKSH